MRLNTFNKSLILLIITTLILVIILTFNSFAKNFISRLIFSHDLSLLTKTIIKQIDINTTFDVYDKKNNEIAVKKIHNYVYDSFKPNISKLTDDGVSWLMLYGTVWCDGVSHIFMRLLEELNVRAYIVFLNGKNAFTDGARSHTVSFVDFNNYYEDKIDTNSVYTNSDLKNIYMYDTQNNYLPYNEENELVNIEYVFKNKNEFEHYDFISQPIGALPNNLILLEKNTKIFLKNRLPSEYSLVNKFSSLIVKIIPVNYMKFIFKFGIYINPKLDDEYKQFFYARLDHLLLDIDKAIVNYKKLGDEGVEFKTQYCLQNECPISRNANFWYNELINNKNNFL